MNFMLQNLVGHNFNEQYHLMTFFIICVDTLFCSDYFFRIFFTFVGLWACLCQGLSLGLEPTLLYGLFILSSLGVFSY